MNAGRNNLFCKVFKVTVTLGLKTGSFTNLKVSFPQDYCFWGRNSLRTKNVIKHDRGNGRWTKEHLNISP